MKQLLFIISTLCLLMSCKTEQDKAEDLIDDYMYKTAYDYDSYEPIKTKVSVCNRTIYSNIKAIRTAKLVKKELGTTPEPYSSMRNKMYALIKKHLDDFGPYESLERDHYDGYMIDQQFRIKSQAGISMNKKIRFIVSKDFDEIIESYELSDLNLNDLDDPDNFCVGIILTNVSDVYRSL